MNTNLNNIHKKKYFMSLALLQAEKNIGNTGQNPSVGCVIVKKNIVISVGNTSLNGRPHAEANAIKFSKFDLSNSDLYVTLEPCSNHGKTPPCVKSIIKKRIKKVFFSINDPDSRSFKKSAKSFKKKNIKVNKNILSNKIKKFYKSYINSKTEALPFVTCKIAISNDYYTVNKKKRWITNNLSRGRGHLLRSSHDCLITSSKTVIRDNPQLTCRIDGLSQNTPSRIILDNKIKINKKSQVIRNAKKYETIIFFNEENKKKIKLLKKYNIKFYKIELDKSGNLDLKKCLTKAKKLGFSRILVESGIKLSKNFLNKNLVNELKIFMSNKKIKKNGYLSAKSFLKTFIKNKKNSIEKVNLLGEKILSYNLK